MKRAFAILVLFAILLQVFSSVTIMINYVVNKDYISKNLCENRDKPMMHCNGKCHLMKQLQKESKKENAPTNSAKVKTGIHFFKESISFCFLSPIVTIKSFPDFSIGKAITTSYSVFHPPTC
jgi:hypothetical protein